MNGQLTNLIFFLQVMEIFGYLKTDAVNKSCECGIPNPNINIVGGTIANKNEFPWMVSLHNTKVLQSKGLLASHFCGGSLISSNWILTAAHCVHLRRKDPKSITVNLGDYDYSNNSETNNLQVVINLIKVHPLYNMWTMDYDVALIQPVSSIQYTINIRPVCIPPPDLSLNGRLVIAQGWGRTIEGGNVSNVLLGVTLPVISAEECVKLYSNTTFCITSRMLCAGNLQGGKDTCQGDSGGPLILECDGGYSVVGIVSWGIGCGRPSRPGIYSRVSQFHSWINRITNNDYCYNKCAELH